MSIHRDGEVVKTQFAGTQQGNSYATREANEAKQRLHEERSSHTKTLLWVIGGSVCLNLILLSGFFAYPKIKYIPTHDARAICEVKPISELRVDSLQVAQFAADAAQHLYSYDFLNYRRQIIESTDRYLVADFRNAFLRAFNDSQTLATVIANAYAVQGVVEDTPLVVRNPTNTDRIPAWTVQVPLLVKYEAGHTHIQNHMIVTLTVTQVEPTKQNSSGLGVSAAQAQVRVM